MPPTETEPREEVVLGRERSLEQDRQSVDSIVIVGLLLPTDVALVVRVATAEANISEALYQLI